MFYENERIYTVKEIMTDLKNHLTNKTPWSLVRWGDGFLKVAHAVVFNDENQLNNICLKEGIPLQKINKIMNLWKMSANISNFIDTPQVYLEENFWNRVRKKTKPMSRDTMLKIKNWRKIYELSSFTNKNFCNPEINFLSCLKDLEDLALPNILKGKKYVVLHHVLTYLINY